ncbi:hypothetical protein HNR44_000235 [Geomicrobium halophilum]|uniref:Uncharacterized protein n=1 Tax=Geomicrobium halophilum TaxID=549000 RepID=A0A841PM40_9BACL|nr:hypothetical protein [Geomicrobium halophilum]MBB6448286.1 hypothetical protein [Geomicrobium halophilum]
MQESLVVIVRAISIFLLFPESLGNTNWEFYHVVITSKGKLLEEH